MSTNEELDKAAQLIADVRVEALKLGLTYTEISAIMMDEATLGLLADEKSLSEIQRAFRRYAAKRLPKWYAGLRKAAGGSYH